MGDAGAVYRHVSEEFKKRYGVRWLAPLGFENTYAIAVRRATADSLHLTTLGDLARVSASLRAGLTPDFIGRPDGLPGIQGAYGVHFRDVRALLPAVKYQALAAGQVDVIDGYSTDGLIARYGLVVLNDDKEFFPPYQAAALISARLDSANARAVAALGELSGRPDATFMRQLNRRVEVDAAPVADVARDALASLGLVTGPQQVTLRKNPESKTGLASYLFAQRGTIARLTGRHLELVVVSLVLRC